MQTRALPITLASGYSRPRTVAARDLRWIGVCAACLAVFAFALDSSLLHCSLDARFTLFLNSFSQKSYLLDHAANDIDRCAFSSVVLVSLLWYAWFQSEDTTRRAGLLLGVVGVSLSVLVTRSLQILLPTHSRPMQDHSLSLLPPSSVGRDLLHAWSSFPSDHAAIYFGLATAIFLANRRAGYAAYLLAVCADLARIYLDLHFLTDVLGGAALAVLLVVAFHHFRSNARVRKATLSIQHHPAFYGAAFYVCFSLASLFADVRDVGAGLVHAYHRAHPRASTPVASHPDADSTGIAGPAMARAGASAD